MRAQACTRRYQVLDRRACNIWSSLRCTTAMMALAQDSWIMIISYHIYYCHHPALLGRGWSQMLSQQAEHTSSLRHWPNLHQHKLIWRYCICTCRCRTMTGYNGCTLLFSRRISLVSTMNGINQLRLYPPMALASNCGFSYHVTRHRREMIPV